jgi:acyl-CoA thioester hydrolase
MSNRAQPESRAAFRHFSTLGTRWMDNDAYGHLNNVVYYSLFDTVVNDYLIGVGALDIHDGHVIGLVVESQCHYFSPIAFPQTVDAGIRIAHTGSSSVRYQIGLFVHGAPLTAAHGQLVHVYVNRATRRPVPIPSALSQALQGLL